MRGKSPKVISEALRYKRIKGYGEHRLVCVEEADEHFLSNSAMAGSERSNYIGPTPPGIPIEPGGGQPSDPVNPTGQVQSLHEARAAKAREDAIRARVAREREEIELEVVKGSTVKISEVVAELSAQYLIFRGTMLGLPTKLAPRLAVSTAEEIHGIMNEEIRAALVAIAEFGNAFNSTTPGNGGSIAASEPKPITMGRGSRISKP